MTDHTLLFTFTFSIHLKSRISMEMWNNKSDRTPSLASNWFSKRLGARRYLYRDLQSWFWVQLLVVTIKGGSRRGWFKSHSNFDFLQQKRSKHLFTSVNFMQALKSQRQKKSQSSSLFIKWLHKLHSGASSNSDYKKMKPY
jgi:hypothetical protein